MKVVLFVLRAIIVACVVLGAATARVVYSGEKEIAASTDALKAGDAHAAVEHARRAAGWYAPGAPHVHVAYERLMKLGTTAEGLGDRETALFAFRGVRTAALETRWILSPHERDREKADRAIARIEAEAPRPPGTRTEAPAAMERAALDELAADEAPRVGWVVVLVGGALACAVGAALVVRRAVGATGIVDTGRAVPGALLAAVGAVAWLVALWRA